MAQTSSPEVQYAGEAAQVAAEDVGQGTAAVNEAMSGDVSSASASALGSAGAGGGSGSPGTEGPTRITKLPETGGVPPTTLLSGILLVVSGSLMHKLGRR